MDKKLIQVGLLLIFVFIMTSLSEGSTDPNAQAKSATELHAEGLQFYNQGQYQDAVTVWLKEFSIDQKILIQPIISVSHIENSANMI